MSDKLIIRNTIRLILAGFAALLIVTSCQQEEWDNYYKGPETSNEKMWDIVKQNPDFSKFVELMHENSLDTIFDKEQSFTLFIPNNASFDSFSLGNLTMDKVLGYHILKTVFIPSNINGSRKLQTFFNKYVLVEEIENKYYFNGNLISNPSSLFKDGMYYELSVVATPKPTLYEYMNFYIPVFKQYIEGQDSIGFNPFLSFPIGFNDEGNTVYDSVFTSINLFERDYFPVSMESRDESATFILFTQEQYNQALDEMALNLGSMFTDRNDIPQAWQSEVLMPYFIKYGVFRDPLQYSDLNKPSLRNIREEDVKINIANIDPESRFICSNGVVFNYRNLVVPPELYLETMRLEGEDLVTLPVGSENYAWKDDVITSDYSKAPLVLSSTDASDGSYLTVELPRNSSVLYSLSFSFKNVFPSRYQFIYRARSRPSGVIKFYVNDVLLGSIDNSKFNKSVDGNPSVGEFNSKAFFVENHTDYGDVKIKVEYTGPGLLSNNGVCIDYIGLTPVK